MDTYTWRLWSGYIIYQVWENIVTYALSRLPLNSNQETTQDSTYKEKIVSEINNTEGLPDGIFLLI